MPGIEGSADLDLGRLQRADLDPEATLEATGTTQVFAGSGIHDCTLDLAAPFRWLGHAGQPGAGPRKTARGAWGVEGS